MPDHSASRDRAPATCAATRVPIARAAIDKWQEPLLATVEECLEEARQFRSVLNGKIAWVVTLPPLGWFGRAKRLDGLYESISASIRKLYRLRRLLLGRCGYAALSGSEALGPSRLTGPDEAPGTNSKSQAA